MTNKILIIAGSDPSGGAGIQADIKTASAHKTYSSAVITCLTAQNTQKVFQVYNPPINFLKTQIETLLEDIKIGMLGDSEIINQVAESLLLKAKNIPIILDPVMVATSGDLLLKQDAVEALKTKLISRSLIITPNIDEAEVLVGKKIRNLDEMKESALEIQKLGAKNVLIKGGHLEFKDNKIHSILLTESGIFHKISNDRIGNKNLHGTGCTLASAIACNLSKKLELVLAVKKANSYVVKAIKNNLKVGKGSLVLRHF